jgi:ribosomal protein S7
MESAALAKPFSAAATLRVAAIENLVPPCELVGQMLGDDALQVSIDHGDKAQIDAACDWSRQNVIL